MGAAIDEVDHDFVEVSNLNRQYFTVDNLGLPKPHELINNIAPFATRKMTLRSYWMKGQEFFSTFGRDKNYSAICVGGDNSEINIEGCRYAIEKKIPGVFVNVSEDGECCRIFIYRPDKACFVCAEPSSLIPKVVKKKCPNTPAIADILLVAAGISVRALVAEIMDEPIGPYNYRNFTLPGFDSNLDIQKNPECPLCNRK